MEAHLVFLLVFCFFGPAVARCAGPPEALDAVRRHEVLVAGLQQLDAACEAFVAFVELQGLREAQGEQELLAPGPRHVPQRVAGDAPPLQTRKALTNRCEE